MRTKQPTLSDIAIVCRMVTVLCFSLAVSSCVTYSDSVDPEFVVNDQSEHATLFSAYPSTRNESYQLAGLSACRSVGGEKPIRRPASKTVFFSSVASSNEVKVKPQTLVHIYYTTSISTSNCGVKASTFFEAGRRYKVRGEVIYSSGFLPVSTGCKLQIFDAETNEPLPLLPQNFVAATPSCSP